MPRGAKSRAARANRDQTNNIVKDPFTVTATAAEESAVRDLPFTVDVRPAPEDYRPDRSPAGRKRIPSPFEAILPDLKGKGWQNQPHDGKVVPASVSEDGTPKFDTGASVRESNARVILRELSKAVKFLNSKDGGELNLGLDQNVTATDVQFNIRDKQQRKPRVAPGGGDVTDGEDIDTSDDDDE